MCCYFSSHLGICQSVTKDIDLRSVLSLRLSRYSEGEIHFNLMAIVSDRKMIYQRKVDEILKKTQVNQSPQTKIRRPG